VFVNRNYFQLAMLTYNFNCWLVLFNRGKVPVVVISSHTTLATAGCGFCSWLSRTGVTPSVSVSSDVPV
jgi:hypothetical protein